MIGTNLHVMIIVLVALGQTQRARADILVQNPELEYHIQTDQGPERFFRFQTQSGQYRKEQRHPDGSVTGSYGWVDPNGVLRLTDYVSDSHGYRIEKETLTKVGERTVGGQLIRTGSAGENVGFEVFPLDLNSDPAFNGLASSVNGIPLGGVNGFRSLHVPEGDFSLTPSYQVASLSSTNDLSNPISKQGQATFYEADPIFVAAPKQRVVIGSTYSKKTEPKQERRRSNIVIGYAANDKTVQARRSDTPRKIIVEAAPPRDDSRRPSSRRNIVIGRTARMLDI